MPKPPHEHSPGGPEVNWIYNDEGKRDKKKIGLFLQKVGQQLEDAGQIKLGEDMEPINPPSTSRFVFRHERMPEGELKVKMEIEWNPNTEGAGSKKGDVGIFDELTANTETEN